MFITHYHIKGQPPFQRITTLSPEQRQVLCTELRSSDLPVLARFKWEDYLAEREKTEDWLRQEFVKTGGEPEEEYPFYFVLGRSESLLERYQDLAAQIEIPLAGMDWRHISFTFPDSMASRLIAASRDSLRYEPTLHGRLFPASEVWALLERTTGLRQTKEYIEAQLWSRRYLAAYL